MEPEVQNFYFCRNNQFFVCESYYLVMPAAAAAKQVDNIVRRGAGNPLPHPGDAVQQGGSGTNWESVQLVICPHCEDGLLYY